MPQVSTSVEPGPQGAGSLGALSRQDYQGRTGSPGPQPRWLGSGRTALTVAAVLTPSKAETSQDGERKAKQKSFLLVQTTYKAMGIRNTRVTLVATRIYVWGIQDRWIFIYPFTCLFGRNDGTTKEVRLRKFTIINRTRQFNGCFSEEGDLNGAEMSE